MKVVDIRKDGIDGIRKHENEEISVTGCLGERYIGWMAMSRMLRQIQ